MTRSLVIILLLYLANPMSGQVIVVPVILSSATVPEHGFLPGKKFQFYPTLSSYDLNGKKFRIELTDDRQRLDLKKTDCSDLEFTNTSEFADPACIYKVSDYIDTLFRQSNAIPDSAATDTLKISLEGIDSRLIGFGSIRVHGLCQMTLKYHQLSQTYCVDITDADEHSPISPNAMVTRLTATRIMASASVREVLELMIKDLANLCGKY